MVERKTEILEAFMRLVSRFGLDKTTMQDIAKEVGISVGVIYKDFKNKEELVEAYIFNKEQQFAAECRELCRQDLPPKELLRFFMRGMLENMARMTLEDRGFWQFCQTTETIKIIHKNSEARKVILREILTLTEEIMSKGVQNEVFLIEDIPTTAQLFLKAFGSYWNEIFMGQDIQQILDDVDLMFGFICRALQK